MSLNFIYCQFPMSSFSIPNPSLDEFIQPLRSQITKLNISFPMMPGKIKEDFFPNVEELTITSMLSPQLNCPKLKILRISNPIFSIAKTCKNSPLLEKIKVINPSETTFIQNVKFPSTIETFKKCNSNWKRIHFMCGFI